MGNQQTTRLHGMKNRRLNAKVLVLAMLFAGTLFAWWTAVRTDRLKKLCIARTRL